MAMRTLKERQDSAASHSIVLDAVEVAERDC